MGLVQQKLEVLQFRALYRRVARHEGNGVVDLRQVQLPEVQGTDQRDLELQLLDLLLEGSDQGSNLDAAGVHEAY